MARKKIEKAHWTPNEKLRPLTGYDSDDDDHIRRERVTRTLDDAGLRKLQHEASEVRVSIAEAKREMEKAKAALRPLLDRERTLLDALVSGTLNEFRHVYAYADDEAQTVHLYDPETKAFLSTREIASWEMQQDMELDADESQESDDEASDE
jgi:hypothetical protein